MQAESTGAALSPLLRATNLLVAIVLVAGASLFFFPEVLGPRWPWQIAPFNMHFLAAIYLSELVAVAMMIATNTWVPVRLVLPMAVAFTVVVTLVSLVYLDMFDGTRLTAWAWFVLYAVPMIVLSYFLWRYRNLPVSDAIITTGVLRGYLLGQGAVLVGYSAALMVLPEFFGAFWPWKIDDFHARLYSAIFLAAGIGSLILAQRGARIEFLTMGISQAVIGLFVALGVVIVDASTHRVPWRNLGTWVWMGGFVVLMLAGVILTLYGFRVSPLFRVKALDNEAGW